MNSKWQSRHEIAIISNEQNRQTIQRQNKAVQQQQLYATHHDWLQNALWQNVELKIVIHVIQMVQDTGSVLTVTAGGCWWSAVVDANRAGHLLLLLAIVKRGYWRLTLPLWLRSMRLDDVVMDTKWLFKEVKREHPAMFKHLINSIFYRAHLFQINVTNT